MATAKTRPAPVISVINMKGGVGKTLISGNVFRELFRSRKKRVLLIDFDTQFNLSQLLLTRVEYDALKAAGKTIYHVMEPKAPTTVFHVSEKDLLDVDDVDSYTHRLVHRVGTTDEVRLLAGDFRLAQLNLRERDRSLWLPRKRFEKFVAKAQFEYDLIVLDCNPSTSFMTRTALEISTHLLIPVRPDKYSILGVEMLYEFIRILPTVREPTKLLLINGLGDSPGDAENDAVNELRAHPTYGPETLVPIVPHSNVLKARSDYTGFAVDRGVPYSATVKDRLTLVAIEIAKKVGL
jgi:chromosome partitioning protein